MTHQELRAATTRALIAEDDRERAYRERAQLVAHLASLYPSRIANTDDTNPDWPVCTIHTPAGQLSWHINPRDLEFFSHVPSSNPAVGPWDGHTTEAKYERLRLLIARTTTPERDQT